MTEAITYSRILRQDLDIGTGTREVRLQDGSLHTLDQINLGNLLLSETIQVAATAAAASLSVPFTNPAGARIHGVTVRNVGAIGATNGLTAYNVGDAVQGDRWGDQMALTNANETSGADFNSDTEPLVSANYTAVITALGGTFDGTGSLEVQLHYSRLTHL